MSVYAPIPAYAERRRHPKALLLIVGGHAALIAAVMTAKMGVTIIPYDPPIVVRPIPIPPDPPPNPEPPKTESEPQHPVSHSYVPPKAVPVPDLTQAVDSTPVPYPTISDPMVGTDPRLLPIPKPPVGVRTGPRFATPQNLIEPRYPDDKRRMEEEAVLRLRLSIDARGRVVGVEPIGRADPSFLEAARRHLMAYWRYKPATEDGQATASSTVITLTFRLE